MNNTSVYQPIIYDAQNDYQQVAMLILGNNVEVFDYIYEQIVDLLKSRDVKLRKEQDLIDETVRNHLNGQSIDYYGVWVYYPWSKRLVHLLDEAEFVELRCNRNHLKITSEEEKVLFSKKIGIVGLSVGQSIALNLALERLCGELRLADFDTLDLSNLNRMRTPIYEIGNNKAIIAARQIAEIDPFIKVKIFTDGITTDNIDDFFDTDGKLDLLIEECDSLDVKVDLRLAAKKREIPVVMDTNDRGMIDIERFDKEPERSIFHGLIDDIKPDELHNLTPAEKVPYVMRIIGSKLLSARLQISLPEIGKSLSTWPQLASDVALGSALASDVTRRILLAQSINSGRYYVDLEELVGKTDHSYCFN